MRPEAPSGKLQGLSCRFIVNLVDWLSADTGAVCVVRQVYAANFLSTLKPKAERKWEPGLYDLDRVRKVVTIAEFDDEVGAWLLFRCVSRSE